MDGGVGCEGRVEQALRREDHGAAGVVEDSEGSRGVGRGQGGGGEGEEAVGEGDVAAAGAVVVGLGHGAREDGAGDVGVGGTWSGSMGVGTRGVEGGDVWWVFGAWVGLRHGFWTFGKVGGGGEWV